MNSNAKQVVPLVEEHQIAKNTGKMKNYLSDVPRQRLDSGSGRFGNVSKKSLLYRLFGGSKGAFWCVSIDFFGLGTILPLLPFFINEALCTTDGSIGQQNACTWNVTHRECMGQFSPTCPLS